MAESGYISLTQEQFNAEIADKHQKLVQLVFEDMKDAEGNLNLRTTLYALANVCGSLFAAIPREAEVAIRTEFNLVLAAAAAGVDPATLELDSMGEVALSSFKGTKH